MKHLLTFMLALVMCIAFAPKADAQRFFSISKTETLTNQDTVIVTTTPTLIDVPYYYSIHVAADSLSGANAGYAYLQVSNDNSGTYWYTLQTLTIDGTGTDEAVYEGIVYARRIRVYYITPSGTRTVRARCYGSFKRVY